MAQILNMFYQITSSTHLFFAWGEDILHDGNYCCVCKKLLVKLWQENKNELVDIEIEQRTIFQLSYISIIVVGESSVSSVDNMQHLP